jgi:steroid delta-isomerase-like uncharacterized protein
MPELPMDRAQALALLERYYTAFNGRNWEGMLDCLTETVAHDINQGERQVGKEAFRKFLAHMERCYSEVLTDLVLLANDEGTRGAAEFIVNGKYLQTDEGLPEAAGQTYELPAGAFFAFEDGKISRVTVYYNLSDWESQVL